MIRFSHKRDKEQIGQLLKVCFGDRLTDDCLDNIEGRYLVFEDDKKILAVTGLKADTHFRDGVEVDWTCTHPEYRHRGLMHQLFERMLDMTDENIYCSCWKFEDKPKVELHSLMENFEFECILQGHIKYNTSKCGFSSKKECSHYKKDCCCQEDLYIRRGMDF